ncbi:MAG: vitamin B12-dependent ribonucleotide reductase [Patescibacteria group bacterium]
MAKSKDSGRNISDIALKPVEISVNLPTDRNDKSSKKTGLKVSRRFTKPGQDVFASVEWDTRDSIISDEKGNIISQITGIEVPKTWTQLATDIVSYKYFRKAGLPTKEGRETSVRQPIIRISKTMADFGEKFGYFASKAERETFETELMYILLHQRAAFNSPVWFNCGLYHQYGIKGSGGSFYWNFKENKVLQSESAYRNPQCSACFILSVTDTLPGIFELVKTEAHIFKYGSGSGANFSPLRSRYEKLSGGGYSSGLMSFLRVFDRAAGATKSGGTTRRAAKMVVVDIEHPEIEDFIEWKVNEEKKALALIEAGYESDFNGDAYSTVSGQNANNSVRVTDDFMKAVENDGEWQTRFATSGEPYKTYKARDLMDKIAQAAWKCADPGLQFDTTINDWHTSPNTDRIYASNPCSEYMFLNDSACNLASINLAKFIKDDGSFDIAGYRHACRIMFIAQEIAVDLSSYPTNVIAKNSHDYRPLGLGYANLGTLLMLQGVPYDSPEGFAIGGALTAIITGHAYKTSAEMAAVKGPFEGFAKNRAPMLNVMRKHRSAAYRISEKHCPTDILDAAHQDWDEAVALGEQFGYRNSQATVIAPTGTIGLLMDCDTTGVEPDFALVKFKKLAGGGSMKIVNNAVPKALENLGYSPSEQQAIIDYAIGTGTLNGSTPINAESLKDKGLTQEEIAKLEKTLPTMFDINYAFNRTVIDSNLFERLGITSEQENKPTFSLLKKLGFSQTDINQSNEIICGTQMLEGAPHLKEEHYPVFDCANRCGPNGKRFIRPMGHVQMMAAVQPFISGAISKTINMPNEATVEDVKEVYIESWKLGIKALALYRDGSKSSQPLNTKRQDEADEVEVKKEQVIVYKPRRRRLNDERQALTHKFSIAGHEGYITTGLYDDGMPGEIFITMAKQGSVISGLMDAFATSISISLQYGVPLSVVVRKFANSRFEPYGFTSNPQIRIAKSIVDYLARYLGLKFLSPGELQDIGIKSDSQAASSQAPLELEVGSQGQSVPITVNENTNKTEDNTDSDITKDQPIVASDAPPCPTCGSMTTKTGTCYTCLSCGSTTGGCS